MQTAIGISLAATVAIGAGAPAASADDGRIVFTSIALSGKKGQIVGTDPSGHHLAAVTHPGKGLYDIDAAISPDGGTVAFERDDNKHEIYRVGTVASDGTGEGLLDLGCNDPCAADLTPSWLPGGERFAFTRVEGPFDSEGAAASPVLQTADADGSDIERLSEAGIDGVYEDYHPRYSPDGSYFVFVRIRNAPFGAAVFRADADGSNTQQLTPWKLAGDLPDLSLATSGPTEDLVVFETYGIGAPKGKTQDVATVPANCASLEVCKTQISFLTHSELPYASFNPAWSPDGSQIAYVRFRDGSETRRPIGDIWKMNADGSHKKPVSESRRFEYRPDWGVQAP